MEYSLNHSQFFGHSLHQEQQSLFSVCVCVHYALMYKYTYFQCSYFKIERGWKSVEIPSYFFWGLILETLSFIHNNMETLVVLTCVSLGNFSQMNIFPSLIS